MMNLQKVKHILYVSFIVTTSIYAHPREVIDGLGDIVFTRDEAMTLLAALETLAARAPRDIDANDSAIPPTPCSCGELEVISRCISLLKSKLAVICTKIDILQSSLDQCCAELNSAIENLSISISGSCCPVLGTETDPGVCLPSVIDVPTDINNLDETIVSLLKTILTELRGGGCCCGS